MHELRFYEIATGRLDDYINHAGKVAVPFRGDDYGKLLGFWSCEAGFCHAWSTPVIASS